MKLNDTELRIGQWWGNGNAIPWRVVDMYAPRSTIWYQRHDRTEINSESRRQIGNPPLRLLSPAELDATGIPDADRICEQQSWREGVELWDIPGAVRPEQIMELHIDGVCAGVTCDSSTTTDGDNEKHPSYSRNVTADPQYAEVWTRQHLADFVIAFRKTRDASVRKLREPGDAAPASESRPCCEAENTLRDLIQLYFRGPGFLSDVWQGQLHRKFELARESLAPRVDGRGKK